MTFWVLIYITSEVKFVVGGTSMRLRNYICSLDSESLEAYANRCGIAFSYLKLHVKYASKDPSVSLIRSLARESQGAVSLAEVLEHFGIVEETPSPQAA
jgi:hypothetical protein